MKKPLFFLFLVLAFSCKEKLASTKEAVTLWEPYDETEELATNQGHENERMRYALIQSRVSDKNTVFLPLYNEVSKVTEVEYERLKPLILDQTIFTFRDRIDKGELTYEQIVLFFLYRIYTYELDTNTTLNTIIALNEDVVAQARALDEENAAGRAPSFRHPIYGLPILLKDNINTAGMKTTAGAVALKDNVVEDAFIVKRLKENGALILGKVNLSEWAYYLTRPCPTGYSAIGGQTLNPYGRRVFDTGGSSSGSGTAMAAGYAVAAVGTETSGSILSPSSHNSIVGLKPTVGLLSRTGIVPISSTYDTPGPMTRNVTDNAILLSAMTGHDLSDAQSVKDHYPGIISAGLHPEPFKNMRLGAITSLLNSDSIYRSTIEKLRDLGVEIIEFKPPKTDLTGFSNVLNMDMKSDLPEYLRIHTRPEQVKVKSVADIVAFNSKDSVVRMPYGQNLLKGIVSDTTTVDEVESLKASLEKSGRNFFDAALETHQVQAVLSINNYHAGYAAVAKYPALTVPMGYKANGEPIGLTFIGRQFKEADLLRIGRAFEAEFQLRKSPSGYE